MKLHLTLAALLLAVLGGCASTRGVQPQAFVQEVPGVVASVQVSVHPAVAANPAAVVAGAAAGGWAGSHVGGGRGRILAILLGGAMGAEVGQGLSAQPGYVLTQVTIRAVDQRVFVISIRASQPAQVHPGQAVDLLLGPNGQVGLRSR